MSTHSPSWFCRVLWILPCICTAYDSKTQGTPCRFLGLLYTASSLYKSQAPRDPDFLCFLYLSGPLLYIEALLPCAGLGGACRQKTGVIGAVCCAMSNTLVACILSSSIVVYSKRVSLMPSVSIVARSRSPPSTTYCLPFVMSFLQTPVPSKPLSLLWTPFRCYVISYFSPSLCGWSSLHAEPYPILSSVSAGCVCSFWTVSTLAVRDSPLCSVNTLQRLAHCSFDKCGLSYCDSRGNCSLYRRPLRVDIEKSGVESP